MNLKVLTLDNDLTIYNLIKGSSVIPDECVYFLDTKKGIDSFIRNNDIHVVIKEAEPDPLDEASFLQKLKAFDSLLDVILVGKPLNQGEMLDMVRKGATDYLTWPLKEQDLKETLIKIMNKRELRKKTFQLETKLEKKYSFHGMVGKSPYMLEIFALIEKTAPHFANALITGEPGAGKKLAAQALQRLSRTAKKRLVVFRCVSMPAGLFEPELFGYKKNYFKEAKKDQKGFLEMTDKGVLYLDEISEMPLNFQAKLALFLEEGFVRPMGGIDEKKVDVKVIASSTAGLREMVHNGGFMNLLFQRLNELEITIPPLRKRTEDIPLLVMHFLKRLNKKSGKNLKGISRNVQKFFQNYEWPGNVRELKDVLEQAVENSKKEFIDMSDLPPYFQDTLGKSKKIPFLRREDLSTLNELEREYILYLLKVTDNHMSKTAKIMGISRSTLYNKVKKYQIPH